MLFVAAFFLLLNDHVLKGAGILPGAITGKLSDVCGLFVLPILIARVAGIDSKRGRAAICAACTIAFMLVKTTPFGNAIYRAVLGPTLIDPTDLIALPSALAAYFAMEMSKDRVSLLLAAIGCVATSAERRPDYPLPQPPPAAIAQGPRCAIVTQSGIEVRGVDALVHFDVKNSTPADCEVTIAVRLDARTTVTATEVTVNGKEMKILAPNDAADIAVPVHAVYAIACESNASASWEDVQIAGGAQEFKEQGGGPIGCWRSTVLAP